MRVGFDASPALASRTGIGRYAHELWHGLDAAGVDVVPFAISLRAQPRAGVARWRFPARVVHQLWRTVGRPTVGPLVGQVDVVHGTNYVVPHLPGVPGVVTIHDLSFLNDDASTAARWIRRMVPWSLKRVRRVITPTNAVADEVAQRYGWPRAEIDVTYEGVSPVFFGATPLSDTILAEHGIRHPFALAVGEVQPRKNFRRLVEAWTRRSADLSDWTLVIAGPRGWGPELPETPGVVLTGYLDDDILPGMVAAATFFCYPSLYEGFGLPPLEAMAAGTPVLAGDYPAARELLTDCSVLIDPLSVDAIGDGLVRLAHDGALRKRLTVQGRAHALGFTWERTAAQTAASYRAALGAN